MLCYVQFILAEREEPGMDRVGFPFHCASRSLCRTDDPAMLLSTTTGIKLQSHTVFYFHEEVGFGDLGSGDLCRERRYSKI